MIKQKTVKIVISMLLFMSLLYQSFIISSGDSTNVSANKDSFSLPVILIHGQNSNGSKVWANMLDNFKNDNWPDSYLIANNFSNPGSCNGDEIVKNAQKISEWVNSTLEGTGADKVDLIAHSFGGLSGRYYLKFLDGIDKVNNFISLGTPNHWVSWAGTEVCPGLGDVLLALNEGDESPGGILGDTLQFREDNILNVTYNSTHVAGNVVYTTFYSTDDGLIDPPNSTALEGADNNVISGLTHGELILTVDGYNLVKNTLGFDKYSEKTSTSDGFLFSFMILSFVSVIILRKSKN